MAVNYTLTNNSSVQRTFTLSSSNLPSGITIRFPINPVPVPANSSVGFPIFVDFDSSVAVGQNIGTGVITAQAIGTPALSATATLIFSTTAGATPTSIPGCSGGREDNDPGNTLGDAQLILVDRLEAHGICSIGDEDWFKFGALGGKVYTIDVPRMSAGLDLSIELYDEQGNFITSNDDFFDRPAATPGSGPGDIRPQIHSWRAPRDGIYYFRVRDATGKGGPDLTYDIVVRAESYGPTPITVPEVCQDLFEPDGLPENGRLLTSNEIQRDHRLCPSGDADWVKFFGKADKIYCIYTDTRPYQADQRTGATPVNAPSEAGADTVLYLSDRDGVSIIDFNDDIEREDDGTRCINPSADPSLDSAVRFQPTADGFYFAQVKNVGDIGNQFIRYDLVLKLCLPNQECSRNPSSAPVQLPATPVSPTPTLPAGATVTPVSFIDETEQVETEEAAAIETEEAEEDQTATAEAQSFTQQSAKPPPMVNGPLRGFADRAFERVWARGDRPLAEQRVSRSWAWGPRGLMARAEGYLQANGGLRQVQYFDKARMEVNDPRADRNSQWFVTTGLLVVELITGKTQIGSTEFVQHAPADIPIAGDPDDFSGPSYASFGGVTGQFPGDRTGQLPAETLDRAGHVGAYAGPARPETQLVHFVAESGHNIPRVFWEYLNSSGLVYEDGGYRQGRMLDWVFTLGYPVSEAYWTRIRVGGVERDVLVQPFQRRVLTYSPDNPEGWQVEMGNVGRHYYRWRYGEELPAP